MTGVWQLHIRYKLRPVAIGNVYEIIAHISTRLKNANRSRLCRWLADQNYIAICGNRRSTMVSRQMFAETWTINIKAIIQLWHNHLCEKFYGWCLFPRDEVIPMSYSSERITARERLPDTHASVSIWDFHRCITNLYFHILCIIKDRHITLASCGQSFIK